MPARLPPHAPAHLLKPLRPFATPGPLPQLPVHSVRPSSLLPPADCSQSGVPRLPSLAAAAPTYSHLARNPFYLSGESFAGHYLPSIGAYMKHAAPAMRLSGVALGNPCTNAAAMYQSYPDWALAYRMIDNATHKAVV